MGDTFYTFVTTVGRLPFWVSSRPTVLHADGVPRDGAFVLASTHLSWADVPLLMRSTPRRLDFMSVVEMFAKPGVGWFFGHMNTFFLDRRRPDAATVRVILDRLSRGRVVAMFPEGRIAKGAKSVLVDGAIKPGVGTIARLAGAPIVPVVVWNAEAYERVGGWMPLRRTRYGVIFGEPIHVTDASEAELQLVQSYRRLLAELREAMNQRATAAATPPPDSGLRAVYSEKMPSSR
jgi:1-acyl-sn-glycerol-3-phosphate acyltransferase